MGIIGVGSAHPPVTVSYHAPIGKAAVGLESSENKNAALPPVEESTAAEKLRDDGSPAVDPDAERQPGGRPGGQNDRRRPDDPEAGEPPPQQSQSAPASAEPQQAVAASGLMRALALAASTGRGRDAVRAFDEVQREPAQAGPHLDQHI